MISEEAQGRTSDPRMRAKIGLDVHSHINVRGERPRRAQASQRSAPLRGWAAPSMQRLAVAGHQSMI